MWTALLRAGLTLAAAVAICACGHGHGHGREDASLRVSEVHLEPPGGPIYIEGAVQFVEVMARGSRSPVVKTRLGSAPVVRSLTPGDYRLSSYTRTCSSACSAHLDQPSERCASELSIGRGERKAIRVVTRVAGRCRIRIGR